AAIRYGGSPTGGSPRSKGAITATTGVPTCRQNQGSPFVLAPFRRSPPPSLQPEGPDQVVDVRAREVEAARGLDHVPALRLEGVVQEADLEAAGRLLEGGRPLWLGRDGGLREEVRPLHLLRVRARRPDDR